MHQKELTETLRKPRWRMSYLRLKGKSLIHHQEKIPLQMTDFGLIILDSVGFCLSLLPHSSATLVCVYVCTCVYVGARGRKRGFMNMNFRVTRAPGYTKDLPHYWSARRVSQLFSTYQSSGGGRRGNEEGMAAHSSVPAWRIPWAEEPGGLQSMGSQRVRHDWVTDAHTQGQSQSCACPRLSPQGGTWNSARTPLDLHMHNWWPCYSNSGGDTDLGFTVTTLALAVHTHTVSCPQASEAMTALQGRGGCGWEDLWSGSRKRRRKMLGFLG